MLSTQEAEPWEYFVVTCGFLLLVSISQNGSSSGKGAPPATHTSFSKCPATPVRLWNTISTVLSEQTKSDFPGKKRKMKYNFLLNRPHPP